MSELVRCDNCGMERTVRESPGWYEVTVTGPLRFGDAEGPKHFCSLGCIREWADRYMKRLAS